MSVMTALGRTGWAAPVSIPGSLFREWFDELVRRWRQMGRIEIDLRGVLYI